MCLLPDEEREISDADKQRAMLANQEEDEIEENDAGENETAENEVAENETTDAADGANETIEENGNLDQELCC